jgi:protein-tyrosine phosphatase
MIDIHNHLLPGVDDGSDDIARSVEQLRLLAQSGVQKVFLTPHYMQHVYHNSRANIEPVITELKDALQKADVSIELEAGAEYFLDQLAAETVARDHLTLGDSKYILVETMMQQIPPDFLENVYELQKADYKIIMAHPERYTEIIRNPELVEEFMHHDILMQVNAGSFLNYYGKAVENTAYDLLQNGYVHFIASDNHGNQESCFQKTVFQLISEHFSDTIARLLLLENPARILSGESINLFNHWRLPHPPKTVWQNFKEFFTGHE